MNSPVMQALANLRMQEASVFGKWCIRKNVRPLPASPEHVAAFVRDCEPLMPIDQIWTAVREVSETHLSNGFADPTAGGPVAAAMNEIAPIDPPRSWPKELWPRFHALPHDMQDYIARRFKDQDRIVRRAQNEVAQARKELAAVSKPIEEPHGDTETACAH